MTRKDTILLAVLINAGLLAILFSTAVIYDKEEYLAEKTPLTGHLPSLVKPLELPVALQGSSEAAPLTTNLAFSDAREANFDCFMQEPIEFNFLSKENETKLETEPLSEGFVDITVKKGDTLEKIAKANHTTVQSLKKANQLASEKLQIGRVLKVPLIKEKKTSLLPQVEGFPAREYYIIKSGDNPWKIAKQYNMKPEDLLLLNGFDEEKARSLKPGDQIRVR